MTRTPVILSPRAKADLDWIYDVVAKASSRRRALTYLERLAGFCSRLDIAPERGTRRDDLRAGLRIVGFERRVTVAFAIEPDRVVVLRLFYGGADWERAFE